MKRKIIITFDDADMDAPTAVMRTMKIVGGGYRSHSGAVPCYTLATVWEYCGYDIVATAKPKRSAAAADSIEFYREDKKTP